MPNITIIHTQIDNILADGICYLDEDKNINFLDFKRCEAELKEMLMHPDIKSLFIQLSKREHYLEQINEIDQKRFVGTLTPYGGFRKDLERSGPLLSFVDFAIEFDTMENYRTTVNKIERLGWNFFEF